MDCRLVPGLAFYPILSFVCFATTLIVPTLISTQRHFLGKVFPFITATGALPPASCYFTFFLTASAFAMLVSCFFKFLETKHRLTKSEEDTQLGKAVNVISLCFIFIGALGITIVGAFQAVNSPIGHGIGALMTVSMAPAYMLLQCVLATKFLQQYSDESNVVWYLSKYGKCVLWARFFFSLLAATAFICLIASAPNMHLSLPPYPYLPDGDEGSSTAEPPYGNATAYHVAVVSEWVLALLFNLFILSYAYDFWRLRVSFLMEHCSNFKAN